MRTPFFALLLSLVSTVAFGQAFKINPIQRDSQLLAHPQNVIESVQLIGNQLTKNFIIIRELDFKLGDTLENEDFIQRLEQSKKNILNTSLFNFARIDLAYADSNKVHVYVHLTERWYLFPLPIFEIDDNNFNTWWQDKDFSRINYGMQVSHNNVRGRKERLSATAKFGFTERLRLSYSIPYIDKNRRSGLGFGVSYNRLDEITYNTLKNKRLQYKQEEGDAIRNFSAAATYWYRKKIFNSHSVGLEYDYNNIVDTVRKLNPEYLGENQRRTNYLSLFYNFTSDKRDSKNYPLVGSFFNLNVKKFGIGLINSPVDLLNIQMQIRKYVELKKRWFAAGSLRGVLAANDNQPYLLRNGLGYNSFMIRSYELSVIDGQHIGLAKAQLKYQLIQPQDMNIKFIPEQFGKFHFAVYLGVFTDLAFVSDQVNYPRNELANELQMGSGIGLDFVSYYDFTLRTEFSINKFGDSGLFFHFVAPI